MPAPILTASRNSCFQKLSTRVFCLDKKPWHFHLPHDACEAMSGKREHRRHDHHNQMYLCIQITKHRCIVGTDGHKNQRGTTMVFPVFIIQIEIE